jgi:hypothetical protein
MADLRLPIELVPASAWGQNLRAILPPERWEELRRRVIEASGGRCAVCGRRGRLHCHERWHWDDAGKVQRLVGCLALCQLCHHVAHIGHAGRLASEGKLDFERVVRHFMRVNGCDRAAFQAHHDAAMRQWQERSRHEWTLDLAAPPGEGR